MRTVTEALENRLLLADGSITRELRLPDFDLERDFFGQGELPEVLNLTRMDMVSDIHRAFLRAGADIVRTNTLRASPLTLEPFGMADEAFVLNYKAAEAATNAVDSMAGGDRRRFVLGVVRDEGWDAAPGDVEDATAVQVEGLVAGGVDAIVLDVLSGVGRIQSMLNGARRGRANAGGRSTILVQYQRGRDGREPAVLSRADGIVRYRHGDTRRTQWLIEAIKDGSINLIGGGASPVETEKLDVLLRERAEDGIRPVLAAVRETHPVDIIEPASSWQRFPEADTESAQVGESAHAPETAA